MNYKEQYKEIESELILLRTMAGETVGNSFWDMSGKLFDRLMDHLEVVKPNAKRKIFEDTAPTVVELMSRRKDPKEVVSLLIELDGVARDQSNLRKFPSEMEVLASGEAHNYLRLVKEHFAELMKPMTVHKLETGFLLMVEELYSLNLLLWDEEVSIRSSRIKAVGKEIQKGISVSYSWASNEIGNLLTQVEKELEVNSVARYKEELPWIEKELAWLRNSEEFEMWSNFLARAIPVRNALEKHARSMNVRDLKFIEEEGIPCVDSAIKQSSTDAVVYNLLVVDAICRSWAKVRHMPTKVELEVGGDLRKYLQSIKSLYDATNGVGWHKVSDTYSVVVYEMECLNWLLEDKGISREAFKKIDSLQRQLDGEQEVNILSLREDIEFVLNELITIIEDGKSLNRDNAAVVTGMNMFSQHEEISDELKRDFLLNRIDYLVAKVKKGEDLQTSLDFFKSTLSEIGLQ